MALREGIRTAFDLAHPSPQDVSRVPVLFITGHHAAFATDALRHVEMKPVLLAGSWQRDAEIRRCRSAKRISIRIAHTFLCELVNFLQGIHRLAQNARFIRAKRQPHPDFQLPRIKTGHQEIAQVAYASSTTSPESASTSRLASAGHRQRDSGLGSRHAAAVWVPGCRLSQPALRTAALGVTFNAACALAAGMPGFPRPIISTHHRSLLASLLSERIIILFLR
ncbi:MAG TPA: hypothetical protein VGL22_02390 [Terracidiphilus sp.]